MSDAPSREKAVGQAVKDTFLSVESFLGEEGGEIWTQWDSGRGGHARLSERAQARLLSCLIGQAGAAPAHRWEWGAVQVYCSNDFLSDASRGASAS